MSKKKQKRRLIGLISIAFGFIPAIVLDHSKMAFVYNSLHEARGFDCWQMTISLRQNTAMAKHLFAGLCLPMAVLACLSSSVSGREDSDSPLSRFTFTEPRMGTRFKIIVYAPDETTAKFAVKAAFQRIADLEDVMSDYRSTSELMRLCQKAGGEPVHVSEDLFRVLGRSQEVAQLSDGAFDVTVGPLVRLWRNARRTHELPDPKALAQARELVGNRNVRLNAKNRTVELLKPGMQLDLGGIGKGYAADAALRVLKSHGIDQALVAAGGDIAVSRAPPGTDGWTIGIAPLLDPDAKPNRYLIVHDAAVSTSGDSEQYLEAGGKRYSHIIDPRTGMGVVGHMNVTVLAPHGIIADPLTKVVSVLGPERGLPIIDATQGAAALVVRKTEKGIETMESKHFQNLKQKGVR
jgi:thiamine biosynthesis lipoprotein